MAESFDPEKRLSPEELAKHLRQPTGEEGIKVGEMMNKGNKHICLNSYQVLNPQNDHHILEIGMGNGLFIPDLLSMAKNINYVGLDFSPTMIAEAQKNNAERIQNKQVSFVESSIETIPFSDEIFNGITTTNTLYFWPNATENIKELFRVLKPGGKLMIAYRDKSCMEQLEISKHGFTKYEIKDVEALIESGGFSKINTVKIKEPDLTFGDITLPMEGIYTVGIRL